MIFGKRLDDVQDVFSIFFLSFIIVLTVFSLVYVDLRYSIITGHAVNSGNPGVLALEICGDNVCNGVETCSICSDDCGVCPPDSYPIITGGSSGGSSRTIAPPPLATVAEMSQGANYVSQGANYASSVGSMLLQNPSSFSEKDLREFRANLEFDLSNSIPVYIGSSRVVSIYSSKQLDEYYGSIVRSIDIINDVIEVIDSVLPGKIEIRQQEQLEQANWVVSREVVVENAVEVLEEYTKEIIPLDDPLEQPVSSSSTSAEASSADCKYPISLTAFDENLVDFGSNGIDSVKGDVCKIESQIVYDAAASSSNMRSFVIPDINIPSDLKPLIENEPLVALHFEQSGGSNSNENVGVVFFRDKNKLLNIKFFSSPDYYDVERKISEFIYSLFFDEDINNPYLSGMSIQEAEVIIEDRKSVPWFLWGILSLMLVSFLFLGKFLVPSHMTLISRGETALNKGDHHGAIKVYNQLTEHSPKNSITQDVLDYFVLLKKKIGEERVSFSNGSIFPKINQFLHLGKPIGDNARVEKMILDALHELKDSPKVALARTPIIVDAYKALDVKSREKLAPLYESLVYKIRDLKR